MGGHCNNPGEPGSDQATSCRGGEKLLHSEDILRVNPVGFRGGMFKNKEKESK